MPAAAGRRSHEHCDRNAWSRCCSARHWPAARACRKTGAAATTVALLRRHGIETAGTADPTQAEQLLAELGNEPLALNDAVHFALVNNPALRARFAELGFAAAEVYDAGRLSNPRLDLGYLFVDRGGPPRTRPWWASPRTSPS